MAADPLARLLILDDEAPLMRALCDTLEEEGYSTTGFTSAKEALAALSQQPFDLVLSDLMMPEMDGISFLRAALRFDTDLAAVLMTGHGTIDTAVEAMKIGALDYILKPFKLSAILPVLTRALSIRRLRTENIQLRQMVAIQELSTAIAFAPDAGTILQKLADAAFEQGQAAEVAILLPAAQGRELRVAAARGKHAAEREGRRIPVSGALEDWTTRWHSSGEALTSPAEELAGISIPMLTAGKLVGVLNFVSARPPELGQVKALGVLAGAAASALQAATLVEELRAAEQRYRRLSENAPDIVLRYEVHPRRSFVYVNPAVSAITGYSPQDFYADPDLALKIAHPEDRPALENILSGGAPGGASATLRWTHKNGQTIWIEQRTVLVADASGRVTAIEGIARDVTGRRELEEQLRQSQKMEAIGRLSAGVAHDFNNLLTVINGYSELMLTESSLDPAARETVEQIKRAGEQAAGMTRQLLAFSRKQLLQPRVLDLNRVVQENAKILARVLGEDVELVAALDSSLGRVKADPGQMEQVLMNLAVNARDAMPQGGRLTLETRNAELETVPCVLLAIGDTGCGMDAATLSRVFEPFFTTKEPGRGTGLGLSIIYGIVQQAGGSVRVSSEVGKGTTFRIYLPRVEEAETRSAGLAAGSGARLTRKETIMVVEDDELVRRLITMMLQKGGYDVLEAQEGAEAIEICRRKRESVALVMTDLVMPRMSGTALATELRKISPRIKVLFASGHAEDALVRNGLEGQEMPFLAKPFSSSSLLQKVQELLA